MDDLGHAPALVDRRFFEVGEVLQHFDGVGAVTGIAGPGKVAAGDVVGGVGRPFGAGVERVGEDADGDPRPFDVEGVAGRGGGELGVPLRGDQPVAAAGGGDRGERLGHPFDAGEGADLGQDRGPRERRYHSVGAADVHHRGPGGGELIGAAAGVEPGAEADVDEDLATVADEAAGTPPRQAQARGLHPLGRGADRRLDQLGEPRGELRVARWAEIGGCDRGRQHRGHKGKGKRSPDHVPVARFPWRRHKVKGIGCHHLSLNPE